MKRGWATSVLEIPRLYRWDINGDYLVFCNPDYWVDVVDLSLPENYENRTLRNCERLCHLKEILKCGTLQLLQIMSTGEGGCIVCTRSTQHERASKSA